MPHLRSITPSQLRALFRDTLKECQCPKPGNELGKYSLFLTELLLEKEEFEMDVEDPISMEIEAIALSKLMLLHWNIIEMLKLPEIHEGYLKEKDSHVDLEEVS